MSDHAGVTPTDDGRWRARAQHHHLGIFGTVEEASAVVSAWRWRHQPYLGLPEPAPETLELLRAIEDRIFLPTSGRRCVCGTLFRATPPTKRFCSEACRKREEQRRARRRRAETKLQAVVVAGERRPSAVGLDGIGEAP